MTTADFVSQRSESLIGGRHVAPYTTSAQTIATAMRTSKKKLLIIAFSPEYSGEVVNENPEVRYFPERGIYNLRALQDEEVSTLILAWERIDQMEIDQMLRLFSIDRDWNLSRVSQMLVSYGGTGSLSRDVLEDGLTLQKLRHLVSAHTSTELVGFAPSSSMNDLAHALGLASPVADSRVNNFGSKYQGHRILREARVEVPATDGRLYCSWSELLIGARAIFSAHPHCPGIFVKIDSPSFGGGVGVRRMSRSEVASFASGRQSPEGLDNLVSKYGAIVEVEVGRVLGSVGQIGECTDEDVRISAPYEQIMNDMKFMGGIYETGTIDDAITRRSLAVAEELRRQGYRGYFGVDYVKTPNGPVAVEVNCRKVGSLHSILIGGALVGYSHDFLWKNDSSAANASIGFRSFKVRNYQKVSWTDLEAHVASIIPQRKQKSQHAITMRGAYRRYGIFDCVVVAESASVALQRLDAVAKQIETLDSTPVSEGIFRCR